MNMKGNNAEKFATTLIIFFVLFLTYILVCIIFKTMTFTNLESMVKDGMSFAVTGITPVVAILLFSDWSEHKIKGTLQLLDDLNDLSFHIKNGFGFYHAKIIMEKEITTNEFRNREDRQRLLWELIELRRINSKFLIKNQKINVYQELIVTFDNLASKILDDLHILEYFSFRLARDKNSIENEYNQKNRLENFQKYDEKFKKLEALLKEITDQAVDIKESIL